MAGGRPKPGEHRDMDGQGEALREAATMVAGKYTTGKESGATHEQQCVMISPGEATSSTPNAIVPHGPIAPDRNRES